MAVPISGRAVMYLTNVTKGLWASYSKNEIGYGFHSAKPIWQV